MSIIKQGAAVALCASVALAGCATTSNRPLTVNEKIAGCAGMALAGAALGAVIGNNVGDGDAKRGMYAGLGMGAGACAVWLAFENEKDKRRIAQLQLEAAQTGHVQSAAWTGPDGRQRSVSVSPSVQTEMSVVGEGGSTERRLCRPLNTTASVNGQSGALDEVWCRNDDGTYSASRAAA